MNKITEIEDVNALIVAGVEESTTLEYKSEIDITNAKWKSEMARMSAQWLMQMEE